LAAVFYQGAIVMKWLRNPKLASALGFLILILLIWFVGPFLGLKSAESRFGWIFVVMLLWVLTLMLGNLFTRRAGSLLEKVLRRSADDAVMGASPDKRAEVTLLRQRMLAAIDTLKTSNLGKTRGKAALYELPWYMIIGHPAAGKSSAIQHSGLTFPFGDKIAIQGVGGTRNCDWFFSTDGVLLDTAGRYSTQREDRPEWLSFLRLLKKHRPKAPVNGILVAISFPELIQCRSEQFAVYARQVRERINEIDDAFGVKVPVYLIFTKIDLLGGFAQFFEDLSEEDRHRVWGATLSHDQGADFNAPSVVGQQFENLYRGLVQLGTDKLADNRGNVNRPALFAFPIEFHGMREAICKFVELLFEQDPYHGRPLLRGFYFTSALQEGSPRIAAGNRVSGQFDLARPGFETAQPAASNGFFLRDLFREVIFPDQHLIGRQIKPASSRLRLVAIAGGLCLMAAVTGGMTWSFIGNQKLIASADEELAVARKLVETGDLADKLKGLQVLQLRIEQLYRERTDGHPWKLSWGLYHGEQVERALRAEYFSGVRVLMLAPVKASLEQTLAQLKSLPGGAVAQEEPVVGSAEKWRYLGGVQLAELTRQGARAGYYAQRPTAALASTKAQELARRAERTGAAVLPVSGDPSVGAVGESQRLEDAYNALKTYLMLKQKERIEAPHLSDQIPKYWRPWLEANRGQHAQVEISRMAERVVGFYVSQIAEPDLPLIDNRDDLVASSREVLRGALHKLSAKERVYNELKSRANTQFPPMTVGRMLENRDLDLTAGSYAVPGAFTREAWEKYFQKAIVDASKGEVKGDDWVLAAAVQDNLGSGGDFERNRQELEALYKADYVREWKKFLEGVAIHDFQNLDHAAQALGKLADAQNSPIKVLLTKAAYQTSWDNPSQLSQSLSSARNTVLERTEKLIMGNQQPGAVVAPTELGVIGSQFAVLSSITTPGQGGRAELGGYLDALAKLQGRVAQIAESGDTGQGSRQLMLATLAGSGSELSELLTVVDGSLLAKVSEDAKDVVRPILVRPLIQTFAALVPPVEQDINHAWQSEVLGQWRSLSAKYPFADSSNEASMADIARFLKPGEGTLAKFVDKHLAGLVVHRGDALVPRTWANLGVRFNPAFLTSVSRLSTVGNAVLQEGDGSKFELQPIPTPGLSEILIEVDGQALRYRNGPQPWTGFSWPTQASNQGARIQVVSFSGAPTSVANFNGRLGLMRLLSQAKVTQSSNQTSQLEWQVRGNRSANDRSLISSHDSDVVRFNFRMVSGANPLALTGLRRLGLPDTVTN
jgi:type VI secretion system protein ImpL